MSEYPLSLSQLQGEQRRWQQKNFPESEPWQPLVGIMEELGELSHSFLKKSQGIRVNEDHEAKMKDAVGDVAIFLASFCNLNGLDLRDCVETAWSEVMQRDWTADKAKGEA